LHKEVLGRGEPVVMLHGWGMHSGVWRIFAEAIAAKGYEVSCVDLAGHGKSPQAASYTLEAQVEQVCEILPQKPCHFLGWSLGGSIALRLAEKYPDRISSLSLIASNPVFVASEHWAGMAQADLLAFSENLKVNCQATLLRFLSLQVQGMENRKVILKNLKQIMQTVEAPNAEALAAGLLILKEADLRDSLVSLSLPVQFILGEKDSLVPMKVGQNCQLLQRSCESHIIRQAGHVPFITDEAELVQLVDHFIQRAMA